MVSSFVLMASAGPFPLGDEADGCALCRWPVPDESSDPRERRAIRPSSNL
jgi:hypothetical protein